jgi:small GTP-binding protein
MVEKKKIVFIGPSGVGKTTIKNVFFEMANPFYLLQNSLPPTRGFNTVSYQFQDDEVGLFDLAGQENENWFNQDREIFAYTDLIICVFDVNSYLNDLFDFIKKLMILIKEIGLGTLSLAILLHKIDLTETLYLQHKVKAIEEFVEKEVTGIKKISIHTTSISKEYFLDTYDKMAEIFLDVFQDKLNYKQKSFIQDFRTDMRIILKYDDLKKHSQTELFHDFNLPSKESSLHLSRLEKLGFLEFLGTNQFFKMTERAIFIKSTIDTLKLDERESKINKVLEFLYLFSNFKLKSND